MGKKNKMKSALKRKEAKLTATNAESEKSEEAPAIVVNPSEPEDQPKVAPKDDEENKHLEQMANIATFPIRLDAGIQAIKAIQKQLFQLYLQQVCLLEACTETLKELLEVQPQNELEEKVILQTFLKIKGQISDVFENFMPAQLELMKREAQVVQMSQTMSK